MILTVHVKPNAREAKIESVLDESTLKISVKAPATEGKANKAVIELLSKFFGLPQSQIAIKRGLQTRMKHVELIGVEESEIAAKLESFR